MLLHTTTTLLLFCFPHPQLKILYETLATPINQLLSLPICQDPQNLHKSMTHKSEVQIMLYKGVMWFSFSLIGLFFFCRDLGRKS